MCLCLYMYIREKVYMWTCLYVYIYGQHFQQSIDQPGMVANPARGQLNRENDYLPVHVRA